MIGIKDKYGVEISEGSTVEVRVKTWNGYIEICRGPVVYVGHDISSWGCGYAVDDQQRGKTFLSSISRSNTDIEVIRKSGGR